MALGFSGSNAGIADHYRKFAVADIETGIKKYEALQTQIGNAITNKGKSKDLEWIYQKYETIINNLKELSHNLDKSELEKAVKGD